MTRQKRMHTHKDTGKPAKTGPKDALQPVDLAMMPGDASHVAAPPAPSVIIVDPASRRSTPTKLHRLITLLQRDGGAGLDELCTETGWQAHSVRGAIAGSLKRKGYLVISDRIDGVRRYRLEATP